MFGDLDSPLNASSGLSAIADFLVGFSDNSNREKHGAQDYVNFRIISLVSHASKIVLKILSRRPESYWEGSVW